MKNMHAVLRKPPTDEAALKFATGASVDELLERDIGPYSTRNSSKGSLLVETHVLFRALASGTSLEEVRAGLLAGKLLRKSARETRLRIWELLHWRFFAWGPPRWVLEDLMEASRGDVTSAWFVGIVFLHYARRDHLTFDFVTNRLCQLWNGGIRDVRRHDVIDFLVESEHGERARWRESTRTKVAGNVLSALRDFGLLTGVQRKKLQRPIVALEVVLHLCRLLEAEGLRGRAIIESPYWHLFLWDVRDTSQALSQLAQRGDIRFERSGATAVLELPRRRYGDVG
jgi:hypothetical protein